MKSKAQSDNNGGPLPFGRRDLIKSSVGAAALGMISVGRAKAVPVATCPRSGDLFAFRAPDATALVFAVAFPVASKGFPHTVARSVRIHAGSSVWTVDGGSPSTIQGQAGARVYVGRTLKPMPQGDEPHHLIVVSTPTSSLSAGVLPVWAEIVGQAGWRLRLGNPVAAELLTRNPALAGIFHEAHSIRDDDLFTDTLADRIAAIGATAGVEDPELHGRRLAAMLLPDILPFDPEQPVGFTFVGQNGRRPSDAVASIVDTMLAGIVAGDQPSGDVFVPSNVFPYFQTAVA